MSFDKIFDLTAGVYFNFYNILNNLQKFRVQVCRTELPENPGTGMNALQNFQKFYVG